MLKKTITYTDFNDKEQTEDFYFNLSKVELTEMEVSVAGGMEKMLETIIATENSKEIFSMFKKIILASVGVKSEDGKRFFKSEEIAKDFVASPAFDVLVMDLVTDADLASEFINGVMPRDLADKIKAGEKTKPLEVVMTPSETAATATVL